MHAALRRSWWVRAVAALVVAAASGGAVPCRAQVRINEILADPGVDWNGDGVVNFKDDEWIEIVNTGSTTVDVSDLRLSDAGALRYGFAGTLLPGEARIVFGSHSVEWEAANGLGSSGLSLNNAGDTVKLWRIAGADTLLADSYTYASHEVLDDRSTGHMPDGTGPWSVFDGLNPYPGMTPPLGTGCPPTPGASNACPTPVAPVTWSDVKKRYASD